MFGKVICLWGEAGVIHVIRDLPNISNVNCDFNVVVLPWNAMCHLFYA